MALWKKSRPAYTPVRGVSWWRLSETAAMDRIERWHADADQRRRWLAARLAAQDIVLNADPALLGPVWAWYCGWVASPTDVRDEPFPAWLLPLGEEPPTEAQPYSAEQAIGADALTWFFADVLTGAVPELSWAVQRTGASKNEPALILPGHLRSPILTPVNSNHFVRRALQGSPWGLEEEHASSLKYIAELRGIVLIEDGAEVVLYVEASDDPDFPWEVGVDDITGHEREELVEQFAIALGRVEGVTEAVHQDREQILVAGGISRDSLAAAARDWWAARVSRVRVEG